MNLSHIWMAFAGVAILATAGCEAKPIELPQYPNEDGITFFAELRGTLELRDGCVVSVGRDDSLTLLAWPSPSTTWNREEGIVTVDTNTARLGDEVVFAGSDGEPKTWLNPPPTACADNRTWLVGTMQLASDGSLPES